jgi:cytochrome c-type protein NapB
MSGCLQCHATDAAVVGVPLPASGDLVCGQCHRAAAAVEPFAASDWQPAAWPDIVGDAAAAAGTGSSADAPPPIPHTLDARGYCQACHAGPAAVAEIRTTHPERSSCRQCHVQAPASANDVFARPTDDHAAVLLAEETP